MEPESPEDSFLRHAAATELLRPLGFRPLDNWRFHKGGVTYDLSAADLTQIKRIEDEGLCVVKATVFVYGTLKRGWGNHARLLGDSLFVGPARTVPGYTLYDLGLIPGMVAEAGAPGVAGEAFEVDGPTLRRLDALEGTPYLYQRVTVPLDDGPPLVQAYLYPHPLTYETRIGESWGTS